MVIGLGRIGLMYDFDPKRESPSSHVLAYKLNDDIKLLAASDINIQQERYLKQIYPDVFFYNDTFEMLTLHKADIVSVCTPPFNRAQLIEKIITNVEPRIIFCEKPVVTTIEDAKFLKRLTKDKSTVLVPNLSRRWNKGTHCVQKIIKNQLYGNLEKIHLRYTRGIYNTGSHMFDLLRLFGGDLTKVQVVNRVKNSADDDGDYSFSFSFSTMNNIHGYAEAFSDTNYYILEMDLFFEKGKLEIKNSGDIIQYYSINPHPLFSGLNRLNLDYLKEGLLSESNLKNAVQHLVNMLEDKEKPVCQLDDGLYPLYVAEALIRSYKNDGSLERVVIVDE